MRLLKDWNEELDNLNGVHLRFCWLDAILWNLWTDLLTKVIYILHGLLAYSLAASSNFLSFAMVSASIGIHLYIFNQKSILESLPRMLTVVAVVTGKSSHNIHRRGDLGESFPEICSVHNLLQLWRTMAGKWTMTTLTNAEKYTVFDIQNAD